jgi:hypothetical protein
VLSRSYSELPRLSRLLIRIIPQLTSSAILSSGKCFYRTRDSY